MGSIAKSSFILHHAKLFLTMCNFCIKITMIFHFYVVLELLLTNKYFLHKNSNSGQLSVEVSWSAHYVNITAFIRKSIFLANQQAGDAANTKIHEESRPTTLSLTWGAIQKIIHIFHLFRLACCTNCGTRKGINLYAALAIKERSICYSFCCIVRKRFAELYFTTALLRQMFHFLCNRHSLEI